MKAQRLRLLLAIQALFFLATSGILALTPITLAGQTRVLVITKVTVIDGTGSPPQPAMTVVIRDERIEVLGKTGKVSIPRGAQFVNGAGKFLIPGLWDMHVHLTDAKPSAIPSLVA